MQHRSWSVAVDEISGRLKRDWNRIAKGIGENSIDDRLRFVRAEIANAETIRDRSDVLIVRVVVEVAIVADDGRREVDRWRCDNRAILLVRLKMEIAAGGVDEHWVAADHVTIVRQRRGVVRHYVMNDEVVGIARIVDGECTELIDDAIGQREIRLVMNDVRCVDDVGRKCAIVYRYRRIVAGSVD